MANDLAVRFPDQFIRVDKDKNSEDLPRGERTDRPNQKRQHPGQLGYQKASRQGTSI